ncbi:MAG: T9SS type A sorting domain-containing protein [Bacteroidales bacterium]|nr:T9SS type A sorting domain-containing protein [Bacteroidales bacterium]
MTRKFTLLLMALLALTGLKGWGQNYEYTLVTSLPSTPDPDKEYVLGYQDGNNYYFHSSGESANQMGLSAPSENTKVYKFVKNQTLYSAKCGDKYLKINNTYVSLDASGDNFIKIYDGIVNDHNEMFQVYYDGNALKAYCDWYMSLPSGAHLISFFERTGGAPTYTVTVTSDTEGCTASADKASYEEGETVTLSYEADAFHYFTGYESSDVTITGSTFAMPANNVSVTAHFAAKPTHSITATVNPESAGTASVTYQSNTITGAPAGAVLNLSAIANPGFDFVSWTIGDEVVSTSANYNYTMPDNDVAIVANFGEHQFLHVNIDPNIVGGTITVNPSECDPGATVTVTPNAFSGYQYVYGNITVTDANGQPVSVSQGYPSSTFTMPSTDVTVSATFSKSYYISIGTQQHCTVSTSPMGSATAGATVSVLITPEAGYRVTNVTATYEGGQITAVYDYEYNGVQYYYFTMPAYDVTVNVVCALTYTVNYTQPAGGTINVSPATYVPAGQEVSIDITQIYNHYSFDYANYASKISVKDASQEAVIVNKESDGHYYFLMPASNVTVSVIFDEDPKNNISVIQPVGCTIQVSPSENVYANETVYLSYYNVQTGYKFVEWVVKDGEETITPEYNYGYYFTMPASENVTVTANVEALTAHAVNIAEGITGGSISAYTNNDHEAPINAYEGEYVYLTNTPEPGYQFVSFTVTSGCGTVEVYNNFYFYMPDCDVTVSAAFVKPETLTVYDGTSSNDKFPIYTWWGDRAGTTCQFVIPAEDLDVMAGGVIKGMKFFLKDNGGEDTQNWECRIAEVDDKFLTGIVDINTLTSVFSGHGLSFTDNTWSLTFDTPFNYSGSNLLISCTSTTTASWPSNTFYGVSTDAEYFTSYYETYQGEKVGSTFIPKTEFTYLPDPTAVFYNIEIAQVEGGTITASKTKAKADAEIELSVNMDEGYTFSRWIVTDGDGTIAVTDNQFTVRTSDVTVTAEYNALPRYNVSLDPEMTNGILLVNDDEPDENGYLAGKVITISDNPSIGYKFDTEYGVKAWKAGEPETEVTVTPSFSIEMPEYDIVISARFIQLTGYTITYHVNGVETQETVYENERINPSDPIVAGTSFVGWATSDIATYSETEPTLFETGDYPTEDLDLYAVFHYVDQSKWAKVTTNSQLNANGGDRVIFVDDVNLGKVMCDRTAGYNYYFNDGNVEIEYNPQTYRYEIASLPTNAVIFTTEKSGDNWKFHYTDVESWIGETTLSCYGGSNINPSNWGGNDNWSINAGYVYNIGYNNCYLAYDRVNNRFKTSEYDWAHMYIEVLPQGSLDAYFTEVLSVSGNESMNEDMEARNLLINEGASYTVNGGKLTVLGFIKNIENTPANFIFTDGAQLITDNTGVLATMKKNINCNASKASNVNWYTISSPLAANTEFANVTNLIPNNVTDTDYDLYRLNEAEGIWENARLETGANPAFTTIDKGRGYIYSKTTAADIAFTGEVNVAPAKCTLTNGKINGFNLIGNPFAQNIKLSDVVSQGEAELATGFYVLTNQNTWGAMIESGPIAPLQGFLVQATTAGNVTISKPTAAPSKGERSEQNINIEMIVSNSNYRDNAFAVFGEGIGLNKINHRNAEAPMLYIPQGGEDFAIAFMNENTTLFPLNFKAMTTGKYSISLKATDDINTLVLVDNMTGVETNMLLESSYSFIGSPADKENRFTVKLGISHNDNDENEQFVYQYGNELIIDGEGTLQVFDVLGRVVISEEVHGQRVDVSHLTKGAYIVRMTGNEVKTQKIIVR